MPDFDDTTNSLLDIPLLSFISQHAHLTATVHIKQTLFHSHLSDGLESTCSGCGYRDARRGPTEDVI